MLIVAELEELKYLWKVLLYLTRTKHSKHLWLKQRHVVTMIPFRIRIRIESVSIRSRSAASGKIAHLDYYFAQQPQVQR